MAKIARHSKREDLTPLTFQLSTTWEEAIPDERKTCIEKATKACEVICSVIAPKDGEKLFQAIHQPTANDLDETGCLGLNIACVTSAIRGIVFNLYF